MSKQQWKEGTVQEFLALSDADMVVVETKIALAQVLRSACKNAEYGDPHFTEKIAIAFDLRL